jgi:hypothetical protein
MLKHNVCGDSPSPGFALTRESDLSPQAGRGEEGERRDHFLFRDPASAHSSFTIPP